MFDHILHQVVDESNVVPTDAPVPKRLAYVIPLFSSRGDRTFRETIRPTDARSRYGADVDDFDKYGQAGLNLIAGLNGGASAFTIRLLPSDAKRAAISVAVHVRPKVAIPQYERTASGAFVLDSTGAKKPLMSTDPVPVPVVANGLEVKLVTAAVTDLENFDSAVGVAADGWSVYPLALLRYYTDGKGGNDFGISISLDSGRDKKVADGRRYVLDLYERSLSGAASKLTESVYFAFNSDAKDPANSVIREALSVVYPTKLESGEENPILLNYFNANYDALITKLQTVVDSATVYDIDPIFAIRKSGYTYEKLVLNETSVDIANTIVFMKNGTDGSLELGATVKGPGGVDIIVDTAHIAATKKKLLIDFWNCDYNDDILTPRIIPAAMALDCIDYDSDVKLAMDGLHKYRDDIIVFIGLDARDEKHALQLLNPIQSSIDVAKAWNLVVCPHAGVTTDRVDNKRVLATYEIARGIPECYGEYGRFATYAGYRTGSIKTMKLDWTAKIRKNDIMKSLEEEGLMYAEVLDRNNTIAFMNGVNQYNKLYSKMKLWRNAAIVGDAIRSAHSILIKYNYDPRGATVAVDEARKEMITFFSEKAYPDAVKVETNAFQTKRDKQTENASCELIFYFPGEIKGWSLIIRARREEDQAGGR